MVRSILVPLDGSPLSECALPHAESLARRAGATLHLVHVLTRAAHAPIYDEDVPVADEQLHSLAGVHAEAYLDHIRDQLAAAGMTLAPSAVLDSDDGPPGIAIAIAQYVAVHDIDLVVMTTHGRSGLARFWLGSTADVLVRIGHVPLLLIRPSEGVATVPTTPRYRTILIPLDGSALAEGILPPALELGRLTQAAYTLLHVVEPRTQVRWGPYMSPTDLDPDATRRRQAEARQYLERVAAPLRAAGTTFQLRAVFGDQAAAAIVRMARRHEADMIALATHGHSGLTRLLLGSVADKVLRTSPVPVLIYRPHSPERGGLILEMSECAAPVDTHR